MAFIRKLSERLLKLNLALFTRRALDAIISGWNYTNKRRFGWLLVKTTQCQWLAEPFRRSDGRLGVDVIFPNIAGSLWELLGSGKVRSSKAVLLNMFQADRDVLHHLTFEDNHRESGWPVFFFFFFPLSLQTESSQPHSWWMSNGSSCAKREIIEAKKSRPLRPADNMGQAVSHTAERTKHRLYEFDCPLHIWYLIWCYTDIFLSQSTGPEMKSCPILFFSASITASGLWCEAAEVGYYRGRLVWHPSFSRYTARTTATSRLVCKPSGKLSRAACTKCQ